MTLLDANTVAAARAALEELHSDTATHGRLVETVSASGDVSQSYSSLGTIACRVETAMGDTRQSRVMGFAPADRPAYEYTVFVAHDEDVRRGDRLTLTSGIVLTVQQDSRGQSQPFVQALYCSEVS